MSKALTSTGKMEEKHRAWLVVRWACYGRTSEILAEFAVEFGFQVPSNRARNYDLSGIRTKDEAKKRGVAKWFDLFAQSRAEFEASIGDIPIASAAYRIKKLDEMFEQALEKRNFRSAAALLEQAAKETGGMFSNRRIMNATVEVTDNRDETPIDVQRSALAQIVMDALTAANMKRAQPLPPPITIAAD